MNELRQLIREIELMLSSADLTNNDRSRYLAEEYLRYVNEFNSLAEECQKLMDRNMILEAEQLAAREDKSLYQLQSLLCFSRKDEFEELYQMYEWPLLPGLRLDIVESLRTKADGVSELIPLLEAYRKVSRSNDLVTKIRLLRKIAAADSQKSEWRTSLKETEEKRLNELYELAKKAIIGKDFIQLKEINKELSSDQWSVPVNPLVLNKVNSVLEAKNEADLKEQAAAYMESINSAYAVQDFAGLEKSIKMWQLFVLRTNYQPDAVQQEQFSDADRYYQEQKTIYEEQRFFDNLLDEFEKGIRKESPIQDLDYIYSQLKSANGDIPEHLEDEYLEYRSAAEAIIFRRKIFICVGTALGVIVAATLIFIVVSTLILRYQEAKWYARIDDVLKRQTSADAFRLLENLKQAAPRVAQREKIRELEKRAKAQEQQEQTKRKEFTALAAQQSVLLKNFAKNLNAVEENRARLRLLIVDQTENKVFERLEAVYNAEKEKFKLQRQGSFQQILAQIRQLQKNFYLALTDGDLVQAENILGKVELLQSQTATMRDIAPDVLMRGKSTLSRIAEMKPRLDAEKEALRYVTEDIKLIRGASSCQSLIKNVNNFIAKFPKRPESANAKALLKSLTTYAPYIQQGAEVPNSVFSSDYRRKNDIERRSREIHENLKKRFSHFATIFEKMPMGAIIISRGGESYEFYYYLKGGVTGSSDSENAKEWEIKCLVSDTRTSSVVFSSKDERRLTADFGPRGVIEGLLEYPSVNAIGTEAGLAPHIKFIREFAKKIESCDPMAVEQLIAEGWEKCMMDSMIAPQMKLVLGSLIMSCANNGVLGNDTYKKTGAELSRILTKLTEGKNYNWLQAYRNRQKDREARTALSNLTNEVNFGNTKEAAFYFDLYNCALSRRVESAGYVRQENGKFLLSGMTSTGSGELWLPQDKAPYFRVIGKFSGESITLLESEKGRISPFMILFTPTDGRDTGSITAEMKEKAKSAGVTNIIWPQTWPLIQGR